MKELKCSDVGFDCGAVIRGDSEEDVMAQAADHARDAHGMDTIDEETESKIRAEIKDAA